ncbi:MAG: glycoside hydrolase family 127 protein [Anaerolineales bacterium]|nr:glycoside hydrolase family 127 protein [Anaerolineales bacterium]
MNRAQITSGFWHDRLIINATSAIFHQWEQLEASGCIENFRIVAGDVDGFREGWFFADSDAYKWLDAASRIYASYPDPKLAALMDKLIGLLARVQEADGYIYTYNQIHFPDTRWENLQIEHELYCHGHLIEAGVSHYETTGNTDLLEIVRRAADLIVVDFTGDGPFYTPGHQEIEIALLRLYRASGHTPYLDMARQFIEQRGQKSFFALSILKQNISVEARTKLVQEKRQEYIATHPDFKPFQSPPGNEAKRPRNVSLRWNINALTGKYFQQHTPVRKQTVPVGHSVRFAYLETAIAMLARESDDKTLIPALEQVWEHMVTRRMYVTGGIGSLPALEGFGNDYELDPEYAYAETCAALASIFWNWEMGLLTREAKYSDLFEWQLYNAAAVGMGLDGKSYFYNNPLTCRSGVIRQPWYAVPCCPSNLSRTWADIGKYIYSQTDDAIEIHQFISSQFSTELADFEIHSDLPWKGKSTIKVTPSKASERFSINLRIPGWSSDTHVLCAGEVMELPSIPRSSDTAAGGYDPRQGQWLSLQCDWKAGDRIDIEFDMSIKIRKAHPKVKGHQGKVVVSRGPIVYCLENIDNPDVDIFTIQLDVSTLTEIFASDLLGGTMIIKASSIDSKTLTFIPYFLWGNRGESNMTVWVNA